MKTTHARRVALIVGLCVFTATRMASAADAQQPVAATAADELGAFGIGVSDLERSERFYTTVLGMQKVREYKLPNIEETVLAMPGRAAPVVVLMHWLDGKTRSFSADNVKLVFTVQNAAAVIERIRALGGQIDREATPIEVLNGQIVGLGRDPDNYVVEVLQRR
jgi:lactoylglutathione lyase